MTVEIQKIIEETVAGTVMQLKKHQLMNDSKANVFQKTEKMLYCYSDLKRCHSGQGLTETFINNMDRALEIVKGDHYYAILQYKYFERKSNEEIAEILSCDVSTVIRNKNRIIKKIAFMVFSDQAIEELMFT